MDVQFINEDSVKTVNTWLHFYDMPPVSKDELPRLTFVASHAGQLQAAASLRLCEGNVAIIEGLVGNPNVSAEERSVAVDRIISDLEERAKAIGITRIIAWTGNEAVLKRTVETLGYRVVPQVLLAKALE